MHLFCILGHSGTGKDRLLNELKKIHPAIKTVISHTSRPIRSNEKEDIDYHFSTYEEMLRMTSNREFIEHRSYDVEGGKTWLYGIHKNEIDLNSNNLYISVVDYKGYNELKKYVGKENITSIYLYASAKTRMLRALERENVVSDNQVLEMCRRFVDDNKVMSSEFMEIASDYCFRSENEWDLNDNLKSIKKLINKACGEKGTCDCYGEIVEQLQGYLWVKIEKIFKPVKQTIIKQNINNDV